MIPPVDTSCFQAPGEPEDDEGLLIDGLVEDARAYAATRAWAPVISEILLAYALGDVLGLFLVRFLEELPAPEGASEGDRERWIVVGDLPWMNFETEDFATPELALELYCAIAYEWGEAVLTGRDLSESYPIPVAPTREHAEMLMSRVEFIREKIIPACREQCEALRAQVG